MIPRLFPKGIRLRGFPDVFPGGDSDVRNFPNRHLALSLPTTFPKGFSCAAFPGHAGVRPAAGRFLFSRSVLVNNSQNVQQITKGNFL